MKLLPENQKDLINFLSFHKLVIYGMGYVGFLISKWCDENNIKYIFCDSDINKIKLNSVCQAIEPKNLKTEYSNAYIVVSSINHYNEIKNNLNEMGFNDRNILSYLIFWPKTISWQELEDSVDWNSVKQRAEIFASWVEKSAETVADYSIEKNYLKLFLPDNINYISPSYYRFENNFLFADFSEMNSHFEADVSSCLAVLMGFKNPEIVIKHLCKTTKKSIIISYVTLNKLSNIEFRRSINYYNDYTEKQFIECFYEQNFILRKKDIDPFDSVHTVYLFEKRQIVNRRTLDDT